MSPVHTNHIKSGETPTYIFSGTLRSGVVLSSYFELKEHLRPSLEPADLAFLCLQKEETID